MKGAIKSYFIFFIKACDKMFPTGKKEKRSAVN